jgi:hypothetical protein
MASWIERRSVGANLLWLVGKARRPSRSCRSPEAAASVNAVGFDPKGIKAARRCLGWADSSDLTEHAPSFAGR